MNLVVKLQIEERSSAGSVRGMKKPRPDVVLIVYDTAYISYLKVRDKDIDEETGSRWYVPAKYCLISQAGWDDDGIVGQVHAHSDEFMNKAIWFACLRDLPVALTKLKEKFPQENLPNQVDYTIDYPLRRMDLEPGASIVTPDPPKIKNKQKRAA